LTDINLIGDIHTTRQRGLNGKSLVLLCKRLPI